METFLDPGSRIFQGTRLIWKAPWYLGLWRAWNFLEVGLRHAREVGLPQTLAETLTS